MTPVCVCVRACVCASVHVSVHTRVCVKCLLYICLYKATFVFAAAAQIQSVFSVYLVRLQDNWYKRAHRPYKTNVVTSDNGFIICVLYIYNYYIKLSV